MNYLIQKYSQKTLNLTPVDEIIEFLLEDVADDASDAHAKVSITEQADGSLYIEVYGELYIGCDKGDYYTAPAEIYAEAQRELNVSISLGGLSTEEYAHSDDYDTIVNQIKEAIREVAIEINTLNPKNHD